VTVRGSEVGAQRLERIPLRTVARGAAGHDGHIRWQQLAYPRHVLRSGDDHQAVAAGAKGVQGVQQQGAAGQFEQRLVAAGRHALAPAAGQDHADSYV